MTEDESAIRELVDTWSSATEANDRESVLSLMDDDVLFLVPGREPFGKKEFARMFDSLANVKIHTRNHVEEVHVIDDWAFLRNRLTVEVIPPEGVQSRRSGYTLTVCRRGPNGRWVLFRDANLLTEG